MCWDVATVNNGHPSVMYISPASLESSLPRQCQIGDHRYHFGMIGCLHNYILYMIYWFNLWYVYINIICMYSMCISIYNMNITYNIYNMNVKLYIYNYIYIHIYIRLSWIWILYIQILWIICCVNRCWTCLVAPWSPWPLGTSKSIKSTWYLQNDAQICPNSRPMDTYGIFMHQHVLSMC